MNIIPFKVVPLGSDALPETMFLFPVPVLEVFMWECPQLVCHDLWEVVHSSKMTTYEVEFDFREKEEVTRTQIRRVWGASELLGCPFWSKWRSWRWQCDRSVVVMQHPSDCMRNSWVKMSDGLVIQIQPTADHCPSNVDQTSRDPSRWPHFLPVFDRHGLAGLGSRSTISQPFRVIYAT
jgi:hypothetical protein